MNHRHRTPLLATLVCLALGIACAKPRLAGPVAFPDAEVIQMIAELLERGVKPVPIDIRIGDRTVRFRALAYDVVYDPFVVTAEEGTISTWRRGLIAWRGNQPEDVIVLWARTPGAIERPLMLVDPASALPTLFAKRRAYRVTRDTTRWNATAGVVAVRNPQLTGLCRHAEGDGRGPRSSYGGRQLTCAYAVFDVSFDLVFEQRDAEAEGELFTHMMQQGLEAVPIRGIQPVVISLPPTRIPGIRLVMPCGRFYGAPNDSSCLSTDAAP